MLKKIDFKYFWLKFGSRNGKLYLKKVVSEKLSDLFMEYAKMTGRHIANTPILKKMDFKYFWLKFLSRKSRRTLTVLNIL